MMGQHMNEHMEEYNEDCKNDKNDKSDKNDNRDLYSSITSVFELQEQDLRTYSPLALAFLGDCVYDMVIRSIVVAQGNSGPGRLHRKKADIVKAPAQAKMMDALEDVLSEDELAIYKRGRNAHTNSKAKNATDRDYHKATGFEALLGYLYLEHDTGRILELIKLGLNKTGQNI